MESKMKIIVCFCTQRQLEDSEIYYTVSNTFHCQCQPNRYGGFFVVPCEKHSMFKRVFEGGNFVFNCQCLRFGPFEYCENCLQIRYILHFVADKICVENVPEAIEKKMVKIDEYFKNIKNQTFFIFVVEKLKSILV